MPWRSSAACEALRILARLASCPILHPCTSDREDTHWRKPMPPRPWQGDGASRTKNKQTPWWGRQTSPWPIQSQGKFAASESLAQEAVGLRPQKAAERLATIPRGESVGGQPGWTKEIRGSGTAAARRLSRHGGAERPDGCLGLVLLGPRPRMDCPTLSGMGKARESCGVEAELRCRRKAFRLSGRCSRPFDLFYARFASLMERQF